MNTTLDWRPPAAENSDIVYRLADSSGANGSDTSYANLFFLRRKYGIELCFCGDFLLRRYNGEGSRYGYGFPLGNGSYSGILDVLRNDAVKSRRDFSFCLLSEKQKSRLESELPDQFTYIENRDDSDYIYMQQELAYLPGKKNQKKRNHISQFNNKYSDQKFQLITGEPEKQAALYVAEQWYAEHRPEQSAAQKLELDSIHEAIADFDLLRLRGGVLYVAGEPVAMTIASPVSAAVCDIHFEKAVGSFAQKGAYAVINQQLAQTLTDFIYINREEDIGIPGLRKAKLSYHPAILLAKYRAVVKKQE
jgi:hypothetical protein